jgi:GMP synthase (glutamine-hydrolysing)
LSGGVDSSVAAVLIHEAIGDQLTCVFVDHGMMRLGESEQVVKLFRDHYNIPLIHAEESELFLGALAGVSDPRSEAQDDRPLFIEVFDDEGVERWRRRVPGARHALSGCDRKRRPLAGRR